MLIHLESGNCCTDEDQLGLYAERCYQSKKYVDHGYPGWLHTQRRAEQRSSGLYNHTSGQYKFDGCQKTFQTEKAMEQHVSSPIHDPLVYECPGCEFRTSTLSGLVQHVESPSCQETIDGGTRSIGKMLHYLRGVLG